MAGSTLGALQSMNRFRRSVEDMSSTQKATLGFLVVLVAAAAGLAAVAAISAGDDDVGAAGTTTTTGSPGTTVGTSTSTAPASSTSLATTTSTTSTTTTTTAPTTSTTAPPERALVLRADGVGTMYFGAAAAEVLDGFEEILGEPDEDTGWVDQQENYGICLGDEVRFVRWGSFQVFFTDGPSDWHPGGVRHFASYTQAVFFQGAELDMTTADGLALGSPVGDVRAQYGEDAVFDDPIYGPVFVYDPPGAAQQWGSLSGLAPDDTIESITGSYACGE